MITLFLYIIKWSMKDIAITNIETLEILSVKITAKDVFLVSGLARL